MKVRALVLITAILSMTLLSVAPAFAAQGQITEVNPSGVAAGVYVTPPAPAQGQITEVNPSGVGFALHAHPPGLSRGASQCPTTGGC